MYSLIWRGKRDRSIKNIVKYGNKQRRQYQKYSQALVENVGVGVAYAHQQVAERTVDVLTATLQISLKYLSNNRNILKLYVRYMLHICKLY